MTEPRTGWQPDPFGVHELRYVSMGGLPTRLVRDGAIQSSDPPPVGRPAASPPVVSPPVSSPPVAWPPEASHRVNEGTTAPHGWHPDPFGLHEDRYITRGEPTRLVRDGGVESYDEPPGSPPFPITRVEIPRPLTEAPHHVAPVGPWTAPPEAPTSARKGPARARRRRHVAIGAALVGIGVVSVVLVSSLGPGASAGADAALTKAVSSSLATKTAQFTVDGSADIGGQTVEATGSGSIDFTTDQSEVVVRAHVDGTEQDETVLYAAGVVYEKLPQVAQLTPGKSWVSLNLSSLDALSSSTGGLSSLGGNPVAELRELALQGNAVTALGPSSLDGASVQGYSVTFNQALIDSKMKSADLPAWLRQTMGAVGRSSQVDQVYVNSAGQLARTSITSSASVSGIDLTEHDSMDFSDYGGPVSIIAPPADEVVPLAQLLQESGHPTD
jgi:hypothetical protein